jgi:hypothetical protein
MKLTTQERTRLATLLVETLDADTPENVIEAIWTVTRWLTTAKEVAL